MLTHKYTISVYSLSLLFVLCLGCNQSKQLTVTGTVAVNGKPVEIGTIQFEAADGQTASGGGKIKNGQYTATVLPGEKIVRFTGGETTGTAMQPDSMGNMTEKAVTQSIIPFGKYNKNSTIKVTIDSRSRSHDFDLEVTGEDQKVLEKERKNTEKISMPANWHSSPSK